MVDRTNTTRRPRRGLFLVAGISAVILLGASPAGAQVLDDIVDDVTDPVEELVSPAPSAVEEVTGTLNDTVTEVTGGGAPDSGGAAPGTSATARTGKSGGSSGGGLSTGGGKKAGSSAAVRRGTSTKGAPSPATAEEDAASYSTLTRRGASAAIARAMDLAGPFAAPLMLAALALVVAGIAARGSKRLVRIDVEHVRTYRL